MHGDNIQELADVALADFPGAVEEEPESKHPKIAIVGRPNVGKSTLVNTLLGEERVIAFDQPGTTRDSIYIDFTHKDKQYTLIDTAGLRRRGQVHETVEKFSVIKTLQTIEDANVVVLVLDARNEISDQDTHIAGFILETGRALVIVVNKWDGLDDYQRETIKRELNRKLAFLSFAQLHYISALHGTGTGDMLDALLAVFPQQVKEEDDDSIKIAIVGKPNVGKSSLLNRLVGQERSIVSDIPGTTRDSVDTHIEVNGLPVTLIDTAGIRRRGKIEPGVEKYSVVRSLRAIERADVSLLVLDATAGITVQDTHIAGFILEAMKSAVVIVNKWDAVTKDSFTMQSYTEHLRRELNFMPYVPVLFISAKTGQRVDQVMPTALHVQEERLARLTTSQINRILQEAKEAHSPTTKSGRSLKIFYGTQVRSDPPTFLIYVNDPELAHFTYTRFLENRFRQSYPFTGTPIRLVFKGRRDK